ncbi:MAG: hypothetical protein P8Z35_04530 [Ignavibacteriaceae bacterium]
MNISEYYPEGDKRILETQIKEILAKYFPKLSLETEVIPDKITENEKFEKKSKVTAYISFSILREGNEVIAEKKIDEISLKIKNPDELKHKTLTSEIFLG